MKKLTFFLILIFVLFLWASPVSADFGPFEYVSPRPGALYVSAGTTLAVREGAPIDAASLHDDLFTVEGAVSGLHAGHVLLADDDLTVIFEPEAPFTPSEVVSVTVAAGIETGAGAVLAGLTYTFEVSANAPELGAQGLDEEEVGETGTEVEREGGNSPVSILDIPDYKTIPDTFPVITVTVPASNTGEGYVFIGNFTRQSLNPHLMILDNKAEPVFYRRMTPRQRFIDFKLQPNGMITYKNGSRAEYTVMDNTYRVVDTVSAGNGYDIDGHGMQMREDGHVLLQIYDRQQIDMSQIVAGGVPTATVVGAVVQELDPSRNVIFQWRSWDHIPITDASDRIDLTSQRPDVTHINSVEWDHDGHILISMRHMDEITKIDRRTADVIWRMGGKGNQFTFIDEDRPYSHQHDVRRQDNGHITMYDNGNTNDPQYSRAVEYAVDEVDMTATKVWEYRNQPQDIYGRAQGGVHRLPNGNTVIAWGGLGLGALRPVLTEVTPAGDKAFELYLENNESSYRAFRFPWAGDPFERPVLVVSATEPDTRLHYSWNGATNVSEYEVYGGETLPPRTLVDTQAKVRFETLSEIASGPASGCYFYQVLPLNPSATPTLYSNLVFTGDESCELVGALTPAAALEKTFDSLWDDPLFSTEVLAPAAAVSETVTLIYSDDMPLIQPPPAGWQETGMSFILNAHSGGNPQPDFMLNQPISLSLTYSPFAAADLDETTFEPRRWDGFSQSWLSEGLTVVEHDVAANQLTFTTDILGEFAIFGQYPGLEVIRDGGFELGADNPFWQQTSTNLPFLICDAFCSYDGIPQSYRGDHWLQFGGGLQQAEQASVSQTFTAPDGEIAEATLSFWLKMPESSASAADALTVMLDDATLLTVPGTADDYGHYTPVTLDVTEHISGTQTLAFAVDLAAQSPATYFLDEVSLLMRGAFTEPPALYLPMIVR